MSAPQQPLSKAHETFVHHMVHDGDKSKSAVAAGFCPTGYRNLLKNPRILAEIERRKGLVEAEEAVLTAKKRMVNIESLDEQLMVVVNADITKLPALAPSKVRAIEMGYGRIGVLVDGAYLPDQEGDAPRETAPRIFRATEARILTHTIETRQEVTRREINAPEETPAAFRY